MKITFSSLSCFEPFFGGGERVLLFSLFKKSKGEKEERDGFEWKLSEDEMRLLLQVETLSRRWRFRYT